MPIGTSPPIFPREQPAAAYPIARDDSYCLVRLHGAQAFLHAGMLQRLLKPPRFLTVGTTVQSSHADNPPVRSLHRSETIQSNVPYIPGIGINLTDWLPAGTTDWFKIKVEYSITHASVLARLDKLINGDGLVAKVSLFPSEWAVALRVAGIVAQVASSWENEPAETANFSLNMQLNVSQLQSGFYVAVGSDVDTPWPSADTLSVNAQGQVRDRDGLLPRLSYAVFEVLALPRRGSEAARKESWGQLLQVVADRIRLRTPRTDPERRRANAEWRATLERVCELAEANRSYLRSEIKDVMRQAQQEVEPLLAPPTRLQGTLHADDGSLPAEWQELLGVRSDQELRERAAAYSGLVEAAQSFRKRYNA
jgi:hypothetical protein